MPALRITDYAGSMAFHLYGLGFRVVWEHRVDPYLLVFAQITRAGLTFYLAELFRDCQVGGLFHFFASNVDEWHEELLSKGVPV